VHLLVLGHVTRDEVDGGVRLGGAASYASLAAARLGYETALVTVAPPDDPLLEPLRRAPRLRIHCVASDVMTTFALDYAGGQRRLWLRRRARPLVIGDVPAAWRQAGVAYVGPVAGECDAAFVRALQAGFVGAGIQGWLRRTNQDGRIEPLPLAEAPDVREPPSVNVAVLSEEDHPGAGEVAQSYVAAGATVAITRGARGATLLTQKERVDVPAAPAREIEATGAGDVFGVVLTLELAAGKSMLAAGRAAASAAARVVEGPGLGTLPQSTPRPF
jgi:sugar/nucleoside kinase (ribokinase family)